MNRFKSAFTAYSERFACAGPLPFPQLPPATMSEQPTIWNGSRFHGTFIGRTESLPVSASAEVGVRLLFGPGGADGIRDTISTYLSAGGSFAAMPEVLFLVETGRNSQLWS